MKENDVYIFPQPDRKEHDTYKRFKVKPPLATGGATLRDLFAGLCMAGLNAQSELKFPTKECQAEIAYECADALLDERSKPRAEEEKP